MPKDGARYIEVGTEIYLKFLAVVLGEKSHSECQGLGDQESVPWKMEAALQTQAIARIRLPKCLDCRVMRDFSHQFLWRRIIQVRDKKILSRHLIQIQKLNDIQYHAVTGTTHETLKCHWPIKMPKTTRIRSAFYKMVVKV